MAEVLSFDPAAFIKKLRSGRLIKVLPRHLCWQQIARLPCVRLPGLRVNSEMC